MLLKKKVAWPRSHEFDEMKIWNSYPTRVLKQSNFELRGCLTNHNCYMLKNQTTTATPSTTSVKK